MRSNPFIASLFLIPVVGGCHALAHTAEVGVSIVSGSEKLGGPIKSEARTVSSFSRIRGSGALEIDVKQGSSPKCVVEAPSQVLPHIKTVVQGDTLVLQTEGSFQCDGVMKVHVTTAKLSGAVLSGASTFQSPATWQAKEFVIDFSGASRGSIKVKADSLRAELSGASQADFIGSGSNASLVLTGASQVDLGKFPIQSAKVNLSGASQAKIDATTSITGQISGASTLNHHGRARVDVNATGASSVSKF